MTDKILPEGWVWKTLGEVCEILDNLRKPVSSDERSKRLGDVPYYGATGQAGWIDNHLFDEELVLLGEDGAPFFDKTKNVAYLINGKSWVNNHAHVLKGKTDKLLNKILLHYLNQFNYTDFVGGTTRLKLTQGDLKRIPIPIPPLPEQQRIAARLDALMGQLEKAKSALAAFPEMIKSFRQAVLAQAVSGRLTEDWRGEENLIYEIIEIDEQIDCEFPLSWEKIKLGYALESSFYGPRFSKDDYCEDGIPSIRTTDFNEKGKIDLKNDVPKINLTTDQIQKYKINKGDLLITRTGSIGSMAIFEDDYLAIPSAYLIRFRFNGLVDVKYVYNYLKSPFGQAVMGLNAVAVTQANLNASKISDFLLPLPPLSEQHEIVRRVERLFAYADSLEQQYAQLKEKLELLPQAILAKAFRGEI